MRVAVVGAGRVAEQHLRALRGIPGLEIGVCDRSPAAAELAALRFGLARHSGDFDALLAELRPDVVHVTTPVDAHVALARRALGAGAHVLVEKPIAPSHAEWLELRAVAASTGRWLLEDHAYQFSRPVQTVLRSIEAGEFGEVVHLDATISLAIGAPGSVFADAHAPHASYAQPGGPVSDFLPHLASLCWLFVGPHRSVQTLWRRSTGPAAAPCDELRALVEGERGTASLGFHPSAQPDAFAVRVLGTRRTADLNLYEGALRVSRRWPGAPPLTPLANGVAAGGGAAVGAVRSLVAKLAGRPFGYEGLHELIRRVYAALRAGAPPPVGVEQIDATSRLVHDLLAGWSRR